MAYPGPTPDSMPDPTPAENPGGDDGSQPMPGDNAGSDNTITLDKTNEDVASAFAGCKVGDTYTVTADDDNTIKLEKIDAEDAADDTGETGEEPGEPQSAVQRLMQKKMKR